MKRGIPGFLGVLLGGLVALWAVVPAFADVGLTTTPLNPNVSFPPPSLVPFNPNVSFPTPPPAHIILFKEAPLNGYEQFQVVNAGSNDSGKVHIAVLSGANSYSFDIVNLVPNEFRTYQLPFNDCHTGAMVLANVTLTTQNPPPGSYLQLQGVCATDGGPNLVPANN
jgi:hypothetical protein